MFGHLQVFHHYYQRQHAVTLWEIYNDGAVPWVHLNNLQVKEMLSKKIEPLDLENCPASIRPLLLQCWNEDPNGRPKFEDIHKKLQELTISEEEKVQDQQENSYSIVSERAYLNNE